MASDSWAIGVDLGGQSAKLALVDGDGRVLLRERVPVDAGWSAGQMVEALAGAIAGLVQEAAERSIRPTGVGVVMPGYMDATRSRLLFAANLPKLGGTDFLAELRAAIGLPVSFDADSNAAALGEYRFGAGRGARRLIVAVVGTGVGGGVIVDGRILRIREHIAGSLGHVIVDPRGPRCACGARGCLEVFASGRALERLAAQAVAKHPDSPMARRAAEPGRPTALEVGQALAEGDEAAAEAVRVCGWWLGVGVASWSVIYLPDRVVIGGGIASLGPAYLEAVRAGLAEVGQPKTVAGITVEPAALGQEAGVIGAAAMVLPS